MTEEDRIVNILKRVGYEPDDLLYIISSHLHFDHAGGNGAFTNTPIIVQRTEYEAALHREEYMKECILPHLNYKIIEGDYEVVPVFNYCIRRAILRAISRYSLRRSNPVQFY